MDIKGTRPHETASKQGQAQVLPRTRQPIAFLVLTIVFIFIMFGSVLVSAFVVKSALPAKSSMPDSSKFQAVFMTNGQVYFGKLTAVNSGYSTLTDVYYLQVQQAVQPAQVNDKNTQIALTKLGNELHGPTDKMNIAQDQILFWEDLKDDSAVVAAIGQYKAKE